MPMTWSNNTTTEEQYEAGKAFGIAFFKAVDVVDLPLITEKYLAPDVGFQYLNFPAAKGSQAVRDAMSGMATRTEYMKHEVKHVTVTPNTLILEIDADIRFPDGKREFVRGAAVFNWDNGVANGPAASYRVYGEMSLAWVGH